MLNRRFDIGNLLGFLDVEVKKGVIFLKNAIFRVASLSVRCKEKLILGENCFNFLHEISGNVWES